MKRTRLFTIIVSVAIFVLASCVLVACNPKTDPLTPYSANMDVVKAFNSITPQGDLVTKTATLTGDNYAVTVITTDLVAEYTLDKNFNIKDSVNLVGPDTASSAAESSTALETAYTEALRLSDIAAESVTGFDFDRDVYMGQDVYKVEIEEVGAKYKYIFAVADFSLIDSEIEFSTDMPAGSYIGERAAYELALKAAGISADVSGTEVIRMESYDGKKVYKVSFDFQSYRYDVSVDALNGDVLKFSKSALENKQTPAVAQNITSEQARSIALGFVFGTGEQQADYTFRKVKLDYEDGRFIYEVELLAKNSEYEFEIAAQGGDILDVEIEGVRSDQSALPQDKLFITRDRAIAAVKAVVGDNIYVVETEIEKENGEYFYEIEVRAADGSRREYKVNALTGAMIDDHIPTDAVVLKDDALRIAAEAFGLDISTVQRKIVKLERDNGALCFKVKLYVGNMQYEAEIDAMTGAVLSRETDAEEYMPPSGELLTNAQAVEKLKAEIGADAYIDDVELEFENGRYVYEIEVKLNGREYDYYVDATTGEVSGNADFVGGSEDILTEEQALAAALREFNMEGRSVSVRKVKLEREDSGLYYDVEFFMGSIKYEAEIDAISGRVIEKDISYD